jgi:WD40-like Beta Propeller Repeat
MSRAWSRWLGRASGLLLVACSEVFEPPPPYLQVPVRLAFTVQPGNATAGAPFSPVMTVAIQDSFGQTVTAATTVVAVTFDKNPGGGALMGTVSVAAVAGVASFSDLRIEKAGANYTLKAAATGLTGAKSTPFTIAAGPAMRLAFVAQPSTTMGGGVITPPVQVAAQDSFANLVTGFQDSVTMTLGVAASGTLAGATVVSAVGGVATFRDLSIGEVSAGYTLTASAAGFAAVGSIPFAITAPTGSLHVTVTTSGASLDPDGYAVCIDSASDGQGGTSCAYAGPLAVGVNGGGAVTVDTGAHAVLLMGVAGNCAVAGENPRTVYSVRGGSTTTSFAVACSQLALHVTTATTGISLDPDGYSLCVDPDYYYGCTSTVAIGVNDADTLSLSSGTHVLDLEGVASNCTVAGDNPRGVDAGAAVDVSFVISCVAAGTVRLTTATTGVDVASGYAVCFDPSGSSCAASLWVAANATMTIPGVTAGPHTMTATALPENCTIAGEASRAVTVPQDDTVDVAFDVGCVAAERIAYAYYGTIALIRADGQEFHMIAPGSAPAWSPDGARLAYECGPDICAVNADSTGFAQLTGDAADNRHPTWSPDGSRIAFAATHASGVPSVFETDLYVMAANGSGVVRLTQGVGFVGSPAWSPDGMQIVFDCRVEAGNDDICSVNADGSGFSRLTSDPARDYGAAWKPDGSALAFATTRYGLDEIVLMSPAGGNVTRIGAGLLGFAPTWSSDGTRLAFVQTYEDYYGYSYDVIFLAHADGSVAGYLTTGTQPAWKPHP